MFPQPRNWVRIGFTALEEMLFENVDDEQTTDACLYCKLTYELTFYRGIGRPVASLRHGQP